MRRPRTVRSMLVAVAVLALGSVAGCGPGTPDHVAPTLTALRGAGLRCGEPHEDNVPSGLLQWSCDGPVRGVALQVLVDGDDKGVFQVVALVPATAGTTTARDVFIHVVEGAPAFTDIRPEATSWLRQWAGPADDLAVGSAWLRVEAESTWIVLAAFPGPRHAVSDPA